MLRRFIAFRGGWRSIDFVIPREVALRIGITKPPIYSQDDIEKINNYDEEAADLLIWVWGFQDELRALIEEFPKSLIPRWFVEISSVVE